MMGLYSSIEMRRIDSSCSDEEPRTWTTRTAGCNGSFLQSALSFKILRVLSRMSGSSCDQRVICINKMYIIAPYKQSLGPSQKK
jgi:hypothetical protein